MERYMALVRKALCLSFFGRFEEECLRRQDLQAVHDRRNG